MKQVQALNEHVAQLKAKQNDTKSGSFQREQFLEAADKYVLAVKREFVVNEITSL